MIIIWADSRWRDSFGLALLSHELDKLNVRNMVVDFQLAPQVMQTIGNHITGTILNHTIGSRNRAIISHCKSAGAKVYVMPTEGKPTPENYQWFYDNQSGYDRLFSWTDEFAPPKTAVTGSPRFQIYTKYRKFIDSTTVVLDRHRIPKNKTNTVFVSAFPQAKFTYKNTKFLLDDWKDLKRDGAIDNAEESMSKLRLFADKIAYTPEDSNIIIRPHPMEDLLWWQRFQGKLFSEHGRSSHLVSQEYIFNLLSIADTWVANENCTTILDKKLAGNEGELVNGNDWASDVVTDKDSAREIAFLIASDILPQRPLPIDKFLQLSFYLKQHNQSIFPNPQEAHVGKSVPMSVVGGWKAKLMGVGE